MLLRYNTTTPIQIQTLNQANPRCLQPFSPLGDVDDNAIPFAEAGEPRSFKGRDVDKHILAAAVPSDKAVALIGVEHFTVPVSSTDGPFNVVAWAVERRDAIGTAVLLSMLSTSVTCGPLCPGPTRTSRVSPG